MSSLRGEPGSPWTLPGSVDALAAAARQAGRPGAVWFAGLAYQLVILGWTFGLAVMVPLLRESLPGLARVTAEIGIVVQPVPGIDLLLGLIQAESLGAAILSLPLVAVLFRLAGGLARLSPAARWEEACGARRTPRLRRAWSEGRGATRASLGLWLMFVLMMFGATLLFVGPTQIFVRFVHLDRWGAFTAILSGVLIGLLLVYSFMLSILFQLALHSLVQNRRGIGSALQHAWRIAKNDPMATVRATLADAVLYFTILALTVAASLVLGGSDLTGGLLVVVVLMLYGYAGCTRCAFWATAYQTLGGLSTVDGTPGN